jgi:hypothetical protein
MMIFEALPLSVHQAPRVFLAQKMLVVWRPVPRIVVAGGSVRLPTV